jgi:hypothetical protein
MLLLARYGEDAIAETVVIPKISQRLSRRW